MAEQSLLMKLGLSEYTDKLKQWVESKIGSGVAWGNVTGKPTTFEPSAHTHTIAQVTNLQSSLDAKQGALTAGSNIAISGNTITATNTTYSEITEAEINTGTASTLRTISGRRMKFALDKKVDNDRVLTDVPANAKFTDTVYIHPTTAGNKHIPTGGASGQYLKYSASGTAAWATPAKADVGLANVDNVKQAPKTEFDSHNSDAVKHITEAERVSWNSRGTSNLGLGETLLTAYRGDRGKIAYDHSQVAHAPSTAQKNSDITKAEIEAKLTGAITSHTHSYVPTSRTVAGKALTSNITLVKGDVGLGNVDNTSDANKPVSTAQQTALNAKLDASKIVVVTELPTSPDSDTFYFIEE